jgi:hypothetical protein
MDSVSAVEITTADCEVEQAPEDSIRECNGTQVSVHLLRST